MSSESNSLCPSAVALDVDARDLSAALLAAAQLAGQTCRRDPASIYRALSRREQVGSTALGQAIAIPHARIDGISQRFTLFLRLRTPIDFGAPDGKLVNKLYVILVPTDGSTDDHLQFLARVASSLSDRPLRTRISEAADGAAVHRAFAAWESDADAAMAIAGHA